MSEQKYLLKDMQKVETSELDIEKMTAEELSAMYRQYDQKIKRGELDDMPEDKIRKLNSTREQIGLQHLKVVDHKSKEREKQNQIRDAVIEKIKDKYHITEIPSQLAGQLLEAERAFGGLENLKNKKILDLGCGSVPNKSYQELLERGGSRQEIIRHGMYDLALNANDKFYNRLFEPWFCRALFELGAQPVGIDIGNLEGEEFEHYQVDLSESGSLDFLPDQSFDGVNLRLVLSSPQLESMKRKMTYDDIKKELKRQIKRLLKEDGKLIKIDFKT